jgi:hypothetical protein
MTNDTAVLCAICGDGAGDPKLLSECMVCSRVFHLNPYSSGGHRDCGDAIIGPLDGVEFWCEACLAEAHAEATAHPVDPRQALERLADPAGLMSPGPPLAPAPPNDLRSPAAPATPAPDATPPAPRRGRSRRRYRRIDR